MPAMPSRSVFTRRGKVAPPLADKPAVESIGPGTRPGVVGIEVGVVSAVTVTVYAFWQASIHVNAGGDLAVDGVQKADEFEIISLTSFWGVLGDPALGGPLSDP